MKSVKITAINPNLLVTQVYNASKAGKLISDYKRGGTISRGGADVGGGVGATVRYNIDPDETLGQFETLKFSKNLAFVSASEICDIPLVPKGTKAPAWVPFGRTIL